ncbi:hypothetical protein PENTCL1PPCAC_20144, partial [Pristionchus entomophagus]
EAPVVADSSRRWSSARSRPSRSRNQLPSLEKEENSRATAETMGVAPSATHGNASPMNPRQQQITVVHYRVQPSHGLKPTHGVYFTGPFCELYRGVSCDRRRSHQFGLHAFNQRFPNIEGMPGHQAILFPPNHHLRRATIHGVEANTKKKIPLGSKEEVTNEDDDESAAPDADTCAVCLKIPPKEPVTCSHCKKIVACRSCLHTWFVSINSDPMSTSPPEVDFGSCLLCRHKWRKIKRDPVDKTFTMI